MESGSAMHCDFTLDEYLSHLYQVLQDPRQVRLVEIKKGKKKEYLYTSPAAHKETVMTPTMNDFIHFGNCPLDNTPKPAGSGPDVCYKNFCQQCSKLLQYIVSRQDERQFGS